MAGIKALVAAISTNVVSNLAAANYPPLTDGAILLGRQYQFESSAPPRIVFTPVSSSFPAKDVYNRSPTGGGYTAEQLAQNRNRSLMNDNVTFEVRCWGVSSDQNPDDDFDYTQALYQQVIRTCWEIANGSFEVGQGTWTDSKFSAGQLVRDGREFVFPLTFMTPILNLLEALPLAPSDVVGQPVTNLVLPSGDSGVGCGEP